MSKIKVSDSNLHKIFEDKVKNFIEVNKDNIKEYFQSKGTISKPNEDNSSLVEDKPISYIRYPTKENNFYLEIYNIAASFRFDNGFFQLINHLNTIFSIFNNKYKEEKLEEKKRLFISLFESIEEQDSEKIDEIIGFKFDEDQLYDIKSGLDKLVNYFGLEIIKQYFKSKVSSIVKGGLIFALSGIVAGAVSTIFTGSVIIGAGVGLGVGVIFGIVSLIFIKWTKPKQETIEPQNGIDINKVNDNIDNIENFLKRIKFFYTNYYYKDKNVIIVAIDKSIENYNDFLLYGEDLKFLNNIVNPKKDIPGTNREYYDVCFELIHKFFDKYDELFRNNINIKNLQNEIESDFEILKCKKTLEDLKEYLSELNKNQVASSFTFFEKKESKEKINKSIVSYSSSNSNSTEIKKSNNKIKVKKEANTA